MTGPGCRLLAAETDKMITLTQQTGFQPQRELSMLRIQSTLCLVVICYLSPSISRAQVSQRAKSPPEIAAINAAMEGFVESGQIAGAVTLVGHQGKIVHLGAVGFADIEADTPMKPNTLFSIASMTKPITATALMILQDEGKLSVDDKVSRYIPAFANIKLGNGQSPAREITIRDALTHTSGLAGNQLFFGSLSAAVDELAARPLAFEPGAKWQYSPGVSVAGRIVEIVSGQPLEVFMQERIFTPLKMNSTTFFPDAKQAARVATLYGPAGEAGERNEQDQTSLQAIPNRITDAPQGFGQRGPNPSGGLYSSARDLFRFYQAILNGGQLGKTRIVSEAAVRQMTSPQTGELETGFTPGNCWGLGWCIIRQPQDITGMLSPSSFGHGGAFGTQGWVDPKTQTIYVLLIQRDKLPNSDGSQIRKSFQQVASDSLGL